MKKRIIIITSLLLVIASIGFVLSKNKKAIDARKVVVDRSNIPVAVSVIKVTYQNIEGKLQLPATLAPSTQADVSATISGKISNLNISLGSTVVAGQVIGSIDTRQQKLNVTDAKNALDKAQRDYQLSKELLEGNAGTQQNVKDAQRTLESAAIKLSQMSQQAGDASIKAPISGMVITKNGEVGEYTTSGTAIATIVGIHTLKAVVFVGEKDVYKLKLNQRATITADVLPEKSFIGKVTFISPVGDDNHNYRVELDVNNKSAVLKAGTYIKVNIDLGSESPALKISKLALVEGSQNPFVYVIKGEKAVARKISLGREFGENVEVLSGLTEGDEIIVSGQINLTDGSKIERTAAIN